MMPRRAKLAIVAFGSSSTEGVGASAPARTYPALLQQELRAALPAVEVTVLNRGVGGEDVDDMMRRLPALVAERPDLIIWQTGSNDSLRQVPVRRFVAETRAGIRMIRAAQIDLMLMEPQDCPAIRAIRGSLRYRDAVRMVAAEMNIPLIRRHDLMHRWIADGQAASEAALMSGDDLHMNDLGYALLAHAVAQAVLAHRRLMETEPSAPVVAAAKGK